MKRLVLWLPLAVFALFLGVFAFRLGGEQNTQIRSHMIGKAMPNFALKPAVPGHPGLTTADLRSGRPRLVNIFGSWCIPCQVEAPQLAALKARGVPIDAVAIRDTPADVDQFLTRYGDPFDRIGNDPRSQIQMAIGSSGVPETFVVDGKGIIRHQHIGEIRPENVPELIAAWKGAQ